MIGLAGAALWAVTALFVADVSPSPALTVEGTGDCPSPDAVTAALAAALGNDVPTNVTERPRVADLGDRFEISVLGQSRRYPDTTRDCAERARVAAVYITLVLNPPAFQAPAAPPPPAPPPAAPTPPVIVATPSVPSAPPPQRWATVALGARVDGGSMPGAASSVGVAAGVELRAAAGSGGLGVAATAGVLAPTESAFGSVTVRQQRFPLSLAVTARSSLSRRIGIAGAAGVALVPLTLRGEGLANSTPALRLDTGVRLAVELRAALTPHLAPFLDVHAEYFPRAYNFAVDPLGNIGSTGRFWLGATAGVSFEVP